MPIVYVVRDTMPQNSNIELGELNELINTLGMNRNDVDNIMTNSSTKEERNNLSAGPTMYTCSYYGTVSIKDF